MTLLFEFVSRFMLGLSLLIIVFNSIERNILEIPVLIIVIYACLGVIEYKDKKLIFKSRGGK